jgi:hypothetical protein
MHGFPRYWIPALEALRAEPRPARVAFAYGPLQISHYAFLAPFLGGHLENSVVYVSPERDGSVLAHHPNEVRRSDTDFASWIERLHRQAVSHLLCFRPGFTELQWAEAHPNLFVRLAGERGDWGLFRIEWLALGTEVRGEGPRKNAESAKDLGSVGRNLEGGGRGDGGGCRVIVFLLRSLRSFAVNRFPDVN